VPYAARLLASALALLTSVSAAAQSGRSTPGTFVRGPLTLELTDSTFRASAGGALGAEGRLIRRGDTLSVHDTGGPRACSREVEGRYLAVTAGDTLRLTAITDPCPGRRGVFSGGPFVREAGDLRVFVNATLIDGTGAPPRAGVSIEVREGRIVDVYQTGSRQAVGDAAIVDLRRRWVIPGLIDAHVHLATDPSRTDARAVIATKLQAAVRGGITSVRDMAGDARALAELARATLVGDLQGPDIHYSAVWAGADFMGDPRVRTSTRGTIAGTEPWMRTISATLDWPLLAAEAKGSGVSGVKLYADGSAAMARSSVDAAHAAGLKVWAHATIFPARPSDLVDAGVDVLSHAPLLAWEAVDSLPGYRSRYAAPFQRVPANAPRIDALFRQMKARGTLFEPTMFVFAREGANRVMSDWGMAVTKRAIAAGVPLVAGTDGMIGEGETATPNLHRELELLVEAGLTPLQAIQSATLHAARAIGIEQRTGSIRPGLSADFVVLTADPLADIRNTTKIDRVVKRGRDVSR
jgi:imidazolonepropionase-like amidohydrolase